jgi:YD repeat-containing protein
VSHPTVGISLSYTSDAQARLTSYTKQDGTTISFTYDANSLITAVLDQQCKVLESHRYDNFGNGLTSSRAGGVDAVTVAYQIYSDAVAKRRGRFCHSDRVDDALQVKAVNVVRSYSSRKPRKGASNVHNFKRSFAIEFLTGAVILCTGTVFGQMMVTVLGSSFGTAVGGSTVTFNGIAASPNSWSDVAIKVPVP